MSSILIRLNEYMYTTMYNFSYLPYYFLPTSMIIISCVKFFDLSIFTFQCSKFPAKSGFSQKFPGSGATTATPFVLPW